LVETKALSKLSLGLISKWLIGGLLLGSLGVGALTLFVPDGRDDGAPSPRSPGLVVSATRVANPSSSRLAVERGAALVGSRIAAGVENQTTLSGSTSVSRSSRPSSPRSPALGSEAVASREAPPASLEPSGGAAFSADLGASAVTPRETGATGIGSAASAPTDLDLLKEARALRQAQGALQEGRAADALTLIQEQDARFANGVLQEERVAARLLARCALGQAANVRAEVNRFLTEAARSPLAPRVRSACREP
jgi:hypothetical protein